jgi:RHS repeat-associated protein
VDGLTGERIAEYVPGPSYVDDLVASGRDANSDGVIRANELRYPLADQQHSTVALMDVSGNVVERYGYDAFGTPTFYDGSGTPVAASAVGNDHLYTGRQWLTELGLYDYRQRMYNPATGRFLTTDPAHDPANLGNPYTYVANNPGAFVDPYGDYFELPLEALSLGLGTASFAYNLSQGNYLSAGVDAVGVALDGIGSLIPILPGSVGVGIQAYRGADIAYNGAQAVAAGIDAGIAVSEGDYTGAVIAGTGAALQGSHAGVRVGQVNAGALAGADSLAEKAAGAITESSKRLPQDIAVNTQPPVSLPLNRPVARSVQQNMLKDEIVQDILASGGRDIRVNQQQVNRQGERVGINRPDIQYTTPNGEQRVYIEIEAVNSPRFLGHEKRLLANDPEAIVIPFRVKK